MEALLTRAEELSEITPVPFVIPICNFERLLLDLILIVFGLGELEREAVQDQPQDDVFRKWIWTKRIYGFFQKDLSVEELENAMHDGSNEAGYADMLHFLRHQGYLAMSTFRVEALQRANPEFLQHLEGHLFEDVLCIAAEQDLPYWKILQSFYDEHMLRFTKNSILSNQLTFDICKEVRMLMLQSPLLTDSSKLFDHFYDHPDFVVRYKFRSRLEEDISESAANIVNKNERFESLKGIGINRDIEKKALELVPRRKTTENFVSSPWSSLNKQVNC